MSYGLHTNNMSRWLHIVRRNGVGWLMRPDKPMLRVNFVVPYGCHVDVPGGVALYIEVLSYLPHAKTSYVQARTSDGAGMNCQNPPPNWLKTLLVLPQVKFAVLCACLLLIPVLHCMLCRWTLRGWGRRSKGGNKDMKWIPHPSCFCHS